MGVPVSGVTLTYEQKLQAAMAIAPCELIMRKPGDWYVQQSVEVKNGSVLESRYGNGETPQLAIEDHWRALTDLKLPEYLVIGAFTDGERKAVRWNGFMWADVQERLK